VSVTNGNAEIARTPLTGRLHHSISAADVGASKPAPAMFEAAMRHAAAGPDASIHVGDDPLLDVEAARRLGMRTVWINRSGARWPEDLAPADLEVSELFTLERWLSSIQGAD
jgi:putative hydrolase of the HAD superfamily